MRRPKRIALLAVGVPGTGKTALHKRITDAMVLRPGFDSVFVFDRNEEWSPDLERHEGDLEQQLELLERDAQRPQQKWRYDGPIIRTADEYHEFCHLLAQERDAESPQLVPRRVIWRMGRSPQQYGPALYEAIQQGNVTVVFSESPDWFTSYERDWPLQTVPGRPDVSLGQLYSQGRAHIRNRYNVPCPIHILTDSQDFAMVHWKVRKFSTVVAVSRMEGGENFSILKREFGDGSDRLVKRVRENEAFKWIAARGSMPELADYRGGGRP